jgi:hypothetical protein
MSHPITSKSDAALEVVLAPSSIHHEENLAMHRNVIAIACQHVRTTSRQRRTRGRRAARDGHLRQPLADTAGGAFDSFSLLRLLSSLTA